LQARSQTTPIGAAKILRGRAIVTGKHTQLTIGITGSATILKIGHKTMLRAEFVWFLLVANEMKSAKIRRTDLLGRQEGSFFFGGGTAPVLFLTMCL